MQRGVKRPPQRRAVAFAVSAAKEQQIHRRQFGSRRSFHLLYQVKNRFPPPAASLGSDPEIEAQKFVIAAHPHRDVTKCPFGSQCDNYNITF
jgi:hypothetical protein